MNISNLPQLCITCLALGPLRANPRGPPSDQAVSLVGGSTLCGVIYAPIRKHDQPASKASYDNVVASLKNVAAQAADLGVELGVEIINRWGSSCAEAL